MSLPWSTSAVSLVRQVFSSKRYLKSPEIWAMCTEGERPSFSPQYALDNEGRIRMRAVANVRERRVPWVPPPIKPLPDHPFQSMNFLKKNILNMLTAHGLIHLVKLCIPITTKAELIQAEQLSAKQYRRSVLEAKRHNLPIPQLAPPLRLTRTEFWWTAGPSPNIEDLPDANLNQTPFVDKTGVDGLDELALPPYTAEEFAELAPVHKWERAEGLEAAFHRARLLEEESITERRRIRRERYAADRAAAKIEREEVRAAGREGVIAQEKRRMEAMQTIKDYADKTGEDVSAWFEELQHANLGQDMPEAVPQTRPVQVSRVDGRVNLYPMWPAKKKSKLQPKNQG